MPEPKKNVHKKLREIRWDLRELNGKSRVSYFDRFFHLVYFIWILFFVSLWMYKLWSADVLMNNNISHKSTSETISTWTIRDVVDEVKLVEEALAVADVIEEQTEQTEQTEEEEEMHDVPELSDEQWEWNEEEIDEEVIKFSYADVSKSLGEDFFAQLLYIWGWTLVNGVAWKNKTILITSAEWTECIATTWDDWKYGCMISWIELWADDVTLEYK
jgi:hypothetical protein